MTNVELQKILKQYPDDMEIRTDWDLEGGNYCVIERIEIHNKIILGEPYLQGDKFLYLTGRPSED